MMPTRLSFSVVCLALVLGVVTIEASTCSTICPDVTAHGPSWPHSTKPYCLGHPSVDCRSSKNDKCPPCYNWARINPGSCKGSGQQTYHYSSVHGSKSNPEWIIEPCLPVSGIENILDGSKDQQTNFLWRQEWTDAVTGNDGRTPIPAAELGLVMNSFYYRSQHQMHIHAAKLSSSANNCLKALPLSVKTNWVSPSSGQCNYKMVSKYTHSLDDVNTLIIDGTKNQLKTLNTKTGALVSANPTGPFGYIVTVFDGNYGDHDLLNY